MEITLEKVDLVIERTGVSYLKAKEALKEANGDVLDAIILIEESENINENNKSESIDEFKAWLKDLINKGNITRIKVTKDEKKIIDVPVNAGIAAGVIAIVIPHILAITVVAALVTKVTIEITRADGTVEVVNKYISSAVNEAKDKANFLKDKVKEKVQDVNLEKVKMPNKLKEKQEEKVSTFTYTVNFDEDN